MGNNAAVAVGDDRAGRGGALARTHRRPATSPTIATLAHVPRSAAPAAPHLAAARHWSLSASSSSSSSSSSRAVIAPPPAHTSTRSGHHHRDAPPPPPASYAATDAHHHHHGRRHSVTRSHSSASSAGSSKSATSRTKRSGSRRSQDAVTLALRYKNAALVRQNTQLALRLRQYRDHLEAARADALDGEAERNALMVRAEELAARADAAERARRDMEARQRVQARRMREMAAMSGMTTQIFSSIVTHLRHLADNIESNALASWEEMRDSLSLDVEALDLGRDADAEGDGEDPDAMDGIETFGNGAAASSPATPVPSPGRAAGRTVVVVKESFRRRSSLSRAPTLESLGEMHESPPPPPLSPLPPVARPAEQVVVEDTDDEEEIEVELRRGPAESPPAGESYFDHLLDADEDDDDDAAGPPSPLRLPPPLPPAMVKQEPPSSPPPAASSVWDLPKAAPPPPPPAPPKTYGRRRGRPSRN
ncbi:hypothetical protein H9P43_005709 [Blastocladiella emersonii ATCC 22665]|nr:hypothetical protein H9P43_005709 [Blastocladiella emersonii ATCC 22665]